jgi:hypothetical protein
MPERPSELNKVRSPVKGYALACLHDLQSVADPPRTEMALESAGGWSVLTVAFAALPGADVPGLRDCDRDCLALLAQAAAPLSGVRVRRELERRHLGNYGLATVKRSLARLKRLGLLVNSRRSPRGYSLAADLPLFRRPAMS